MPWVTPEPLDPETLRINRERAMIRESIPIGWEMLHIRNNYDVDPDKIGTPKWGICGHQHVCLLVNHWLHPYPFMPRACDLEPRMSHSGLGVS